MNDLDYCLDFVEAHENSIDMNFKRIKEINSDYEATKKLFDNARDWEKIRKLRHIQDGLVRERMKLLKPFHALLPNLECLFGNECADIIYAIADCSNMSTFGTGIGLFSSTSIAFQGKISLQCDASWKESTAIWSLNCAPSGSGKSTVVGLLHSPLEGSSANITTSNLDLFSDENQKIIIRELEAQKRKMIQEEMKANNFKYSRELKVNIEEKMKELNHVQKELLSSFSLQNREIIFADNVTSQGLCNLLYHNKEVVAIMTSEGTIIPRFESETDITPYLKGYGQEGGTYQLGKQMITLKHPYLILTIFTQNEIGAEFLLKDKFINAGLCGRFLVCIQSDCETNNGIIGEQYNGSILHYRERYNNKIKHLYEFLSNPGIDPLTIIVELDRDAYQMVKTFQQKIKDGLTGFPKKMRSWLKKAHGHAVRIAYCIHVWNNSNPLKTNITEREMERAIKIVEVLMDNLWFIYGEEGYTAHKNAEKIIKSLLRIDHPREIMDNGITSRTLQQRTGLKKEETDNALYLLDKHDYIRIYDNGINSPTVILHPLFYERRENPFLR